jgi:hypothetical protein
MKHLFNDIPKSEKQRILEMHGVKRNLIPESVESEQAEQEYSLLPDSEKNTWLKVIKECIKDLKSGAIVTSDIVTSTLGVGLIVIGVKTKKPLLCVLGAGMITALAHFEKGVWEEIILCAHKKKNTSFSFMMEQVVTTSTNNSQKPYLYLELVNFKNPQDKKLIWDGSKQTEGEEVKNIVMSLQKEFNPDLVPTGNINDTNFSKLAKKLNDTYCIGGATESNPITMGWKIKTKYDCTIKPPIGS